MEVKQLKIPELVVKEVKQFDEEAQIILFGSRARGEARKDSDWDFLILLDKPITEQLVDLIREKIYDIELDKEEVISTIIEGKEEWKKYSESLIYRNIVNEGQRLN